MVEGWRLSGANLVVDPLITVDVCQPDGKAFMKGEGG